MNNDLKIGLALGSGSSRGWAHIGIIDELARLGVDSVKIHNLYAARNTPLADQVQRAIIDSVGHVAASIPGQA